MKRFLLSFALFAAFAAFATPVSTNEAATAVANWLASGQAMGCTGMGSVAGVEAYDAKGGTGRFYVISLRNDEGAAVGYVVTSADRSLNPVLAYSESGTFEATDKNPLWTMLGIDVPSATRAVEAAAAQPGGSRLASVAPGGSSAANGQNARSPGANERKWAQLLSGSRLQGTSLSSISDVRVNTLLETRWGQSGRGENYYTPKSYVCGCVATAMAQIMRYWRYPTQSITLNYPYNDDGSYVGPGNGTRSYEGEIDGEAGRWNAVDGYKKTSSSGYTAWSPAFGGTYDWNNMPASGASSSGFIFTTLNETEAAAIGKLTRDCGISVHMDFSDDGSGSANYLAPKRLMDQFGYANAVAYYHKGGCTIDEIKRAILPSLDLKSPCGVSVPGHAIVADGYGYNNDTLYVHFNMGWSGSDNVWYNPPDLTDSGYSDFNSISTIYYNVYPPSVCSEAGRSVVSGRVLSQSGNPVSGVTVTAQNKSSGASYSSVAATDSKGIYALLLPAGSYRVRAASGETAAVVDVDVQSGAKSATVNDKVAGSTVSYGSSNGIGGVNRNVYGVELALDQTVVTVATPVFAPKSGTVFFRNGQPVTLSCVTDGAEIRYTLDGSEPTEQSALYEGPIAISASATIKARAFMAGMESSEVVAATYVRKDIIGENLVQNAAPVQGEVQTLSVAAPGTYAVSFDYAGKSGRYGERMELRLAKGGATNTLVSVTATSAGTFTTNFTFDVSSAGDWDLFVYNPASGATQPVTLSNLLIFIPETDESLGQYWIYETERTFGSTGEWNAEPTFQDGKMGFEGRETFTPYEEQNGRRAVITLTMSFNYIADEELDFGEIPKTAVRIAEDKTSGGRTFSLLTSADGAPVWRNVSAEGAGEPQLDVSYTFKFAMDCAAGTFTVALVNGDAETPLLDGANDTFAFANRRQTPVEEIEFQGSVYLDSLYGSYDDFVAAFAEGDVLALAGGALSDGLTAAQAAWLNSMNAYDAVKAKVGTIGADAFLDAWLLNLDLREEPLGSGALKVSGIEVTETEVKVSVKLERTGAMQNAAINGVLKLYGGTSLDVMAPLNETPVTNEDLASGDTALFVYPRSGEAKFFRPAIRQR